MTEPTPSTEPNTGPIATTPPPAAPHAEPPPPPPHEYGRERGYLRRPSRLNAVAAWVGIVAGIVFIVAVIFFSGFALGAHSGGGHHRWGGGHGDHRGGGEMHRGGQGMGPGMGPAMGPGMGPMFRPGPGFIFPTGPGGPGGFGPGGPGGQEQTPGSTAPTPPTR
jgi:hypothetical protein